MARKRNRIVFEGLEVIDAGAKGKAVAKAPSSQSDVATFLAYIENQGETFRDRLRLKLDTKNIKPLVSTVRHSDSENEEEPNANIVKKKKGGNKRGVHEWNYYFSDYLISICTKILTCL